MAKSTTSPHIVHFSSVHKVDDVRVFFKECRSLAAAGNRVTLVARGDGEDEKDGVRRIGISSTAPGGRIGRMLFGTIGVVRQAWREKGDLYHFHDPELLPFGLLFKLSGKKVIYDAHESIRDQILSKPYIPKPLRKPISRAVGVLEDFSIRRFDGVVTATPHIAEILHTDHTVAVGNYPVSEEIVGPDDSVTREADKVVFIGGFTKIRGSREMVDAMEIANQTLPARLVICGTMSADVRAEVESLPGWKYVEDLGWQDRESTRMHRATGMCGLCVFHPEPNHMEALPNKLFEYMGSGLPVVASDFSYWKQFVQDIGSGVMVNPLDPQSIANGIVAVLADRQKAIAMGQAGAKAVANKYNWTSESEKLIELTRRVLG